MTDIFFGSLKRIIVVRHGKENSFGDLNSIGNEQITILTRHLRQLISSESCVAILTSPEFRAIESAKIISAVFNVRFQICDVLKLDLKSAVSQQIKVIIEKTTICGADTAIVVAHSESPAIIIKSLERIFFQKDGGEINTDNGNGGMINLTTGEIIQSILPKDLPKKEERFFEQPKSIQPITGFWVRFWRGLKEEWFFF